MPRLSTSSWSLHRALGRPPLTGPQDPPPTGPMPGAEVDLLDLPARLAQMGVPTLEIVHFHLPSLDASYLSELRAALAAAQVELFSVLIDAGDITHPDPAQRQREMAWIRGWIDVAADLGASHARVVAGYTPVQPQTGDLRAHPVLRLSAENLRSLAAYARERGVQVITENFRETAARAAQVLALLDLCEGEVGLCADFGNFKGPDRYDELAAIFPRADSAHVKALYDGDGRPVRAEFQRTLGMLLDAGFDGPMSLIFDGPLHRDEDEWDNLAVLRGMVAGMLPNGR